MKPEGWEPEAPWARTAGNRSQEPGTVNRNGGNRNRRGPEPRVTLSRVPERWEPEPPWARTAGNRLPIWTEPGPSRCEAQNPKLLCLNKFVVHFDLHLQDHAFQELPCLGWRILAATTCDSTVGRTLHDISQLGQLELKVDANRQVNSLSQNGYGGSRLFVSMFVGLACHEPNHKPQKPLNPKETKANKKNKSRSMQMVSILIKIMNRFWLNFEAVLNHFWIILGLIPNSILSLILDRFWIDFRFNFGSILRSLTSDFGRGRFWSHFLTFGTPLGPQADAKKNSLFPNASSAGPLGFPKMDQKSTLGQFLTHFWRPPGPLFLHSWRGRFSMYLHGDLAFWAFFGTSDACKFGSNF